MRRLLVISAAVLCALFAAGCGNKEEVVTEAHTEGIYLDVDHLKYQVQISRYMNPNDVEDRSYLAGLPSSTSQPGGDETWFGVFIRVQNTTDETIAPANDFMIVDTQDKKYRPVPIDTNVNPFAFKPGIAVPGNTIFPLSSSAAGQGPIQGSLLLFKVPYANLQNRPLEFEISDPANPSKKASVALDV